MPLVSSQKVLCIGDVMLDVVVALQAPINYGEDTPSKITTHGGGAAGNVASWIAHTGIAASIVARIGNDSAGAALISEFQDLGVDHSSLNDRDGETNAHSGKGKISRGGALISHDNKKLTDIKDGTSSTIGVAEQSDFCVDVNKAKIDCRSDFGHSFSMGPGPVGDNRHWNITSVRYKINDKTWENKGVSEVFYGQNRPLQSAHSGGINAVFMDGGVRFLTDGLSLQILYNLSNIDDGKISADY